MNVFKTIIYHRRKDTYHESGLLLFWCVAQLSEVKLI